MQNHYAFVIIKTEKSILGKMPSIIEKELNDRIATQETMKEMSFEESVDFIKKRKITQYSTIVEALAKKIEEPLQQYGPNATEGNKKFEEWSPEDIFTPTELIDGFDTIEYFPEAIVLPTQKWVEMGYGENEEEDKEIFKEWSRYIIRALSDHEEDSLVLVIRYEN